MAKHVKIIQAANNALTIVPMIKGGDIEDLIFGVTKEPKQYHITVSPCDMDRITCALRLNFISELSGKLILMDSQKKKIAVSCAIPCDTFNLSLATQLQTVCITEVKTEDNDIELVLSVETSDDIEDFIYSGYKIPMQFKVLINSEKEGSRLKAILHIRDLSELVGQHALFDNLAKKLTFFCISGYKEK